MATASGQDTLLGGALAKSFAIALAAGLLSVVFFSPRFAFWQGLNTTYLYRVPECSRARASLDQIDDPWQPVTNPLHRVIGWRLLFPLAWHYLSLPRWLFFAMPQVGCLLALWLAARLTQQRLRDWVYTALATLVFATLPWFFVSTGWLGYFDSWLVLGLLTVAFVPSPWALGATCLLAPWIDERILLALPICLLIRGVGIDRDDPARPRQWLRGLAIVAATCLPYLIVRVVAWARGDSIAADYVARHQAQVQNVHWTQYIEALWYGYRAAWIFVLATVWFSFHQTNRRQGLAFAVVLGITALGSLFIASDMTRSLMMVCPVLLLGIWQWHDVRAASFRWALPAVAAANLLLPASHVLWEMKVPIVYLRYELLQLETPPAGFDPERYLQEGQASLNLGRYSEAEVALDTALELDATNPNAHLLKALLCFRQGNLDAAERESDAALVLSPDLPDALYLRGTIMARRGARAAAVPDVQRALQVAPGDWPRREEAQQFLNALNRP